jgi:flavoprotein
MLQTLKRIKKVFPKVSPELWLNALFLSGKIQLENVEKLRRIHGITILSREGEIEDVVKSYG